MVKITIKMELGNFVPELPSLMIFQGQLFCFSLRFCLVCIEMVNKILYPNSHKGTFPVLNLYFIITDRADCWMGLTEAGREN